MLVARAAVTPLIAVVYFYPRYSTSLLMLGVPWAFAAPAAALALALFFRDEGAALIKTGGPLHSPA